MCFPRARAAACRGSGRGLRAGRSVSWLWITDQQSWDWTSESIVSPPEGKGETEAKEGRTCPGSHCGWNRAQIATSPEGQSGLYAMPLHHAGKAFMGGTMPSPAPGGSLALPGHIALSPTWPLGVKTRWLWLWAHLRPGSGLGVWPGLCVRNQGLVCGWGQNRGMKAMNWLEKPKRRPAPENRAAGGAGAGMAEVGNWGSQVSGDWRKGSSPHRVPLCTRHFLALGVWDCCTHSPESPTSVLWGRSCWKPQSSLPAELASCGAREPSSPQDLHSTCVQLSPHPTPQHTHSSPIGEEKLFTG